MVSSQPSRKVKKMLRAAGWIPTTAQGSHTKWRAPSGRSVTVPDGHRSISPGVYRQILRAIEEESR
ncbi:type II toxin-antitoxin system HicA family toxin [Agrococcus baldri]|nr:type II toxin-antitoxin system HicA family toxin [Agrococcus baldri]